MVVHGEQSFDYTRPLYANEEVVVSSTIANISTARSNELITMEQQIKTTDGELIVTTTNVTVSRGSAPTEKS
jgi:acyl-CoA thioesterase FadM